MKRTDFKKHAAALLLMLCLLAVSALPAFATSANIKLTDGHGNPNTGSIHINLYDSTNNKALSGGEHVHTVFLSAQGAPFNQEKARELTPPRYVLCAPSHRMLLPLLILSPERNRSEPSLRPPHLPARHVPLLIRMSNPHRRKMQQPSSLFPGSTVLMLPFVPSYSKPAFFLLCISTRASARRLPSS